MSCFDFSRCRRLWLCQRARHSGSSLQRAKLSLKPNQPRIRRCKVGRTIKINGNIQFPAKNKLPSEQTAQMPAVHWKHPGGAGYSAGDTLIALLMRRAPLSPLMLPFLKPPSYAWLVKHHEYKPNHSYNIFLLIEISRAYFKGEKRGKELFLNS